MPTQILPFIPHLLTTLERRPYVFIFLLFFLVFSILQWGKLRTFIFLGLGWCMAWISEISSIRNGFPYGIYHYVYENLRGELLLLGVPLWDSLSYTFLAYASFSTAIQMRVGSAQKNLNDLEFVKIRTSPQVLLMSVLLMAGIDVIIDPLANMGERWFLGKIYYYPQGGQYFGVPFSNFLGWGLVAFAIIFTFQQIERRLYHCGNVIPKKQREGLRQWLGVALFMGVYFFNWGITLWLKEFKLAGFDLLWLTILFFPLYFPHLCLRLKKNH